MHRRNVGEWALNVEPRTPRARIGQGAKPQTLLLKKSREIGTLH